MPQLDISTFLPQLFWLFISFGLLYILLSKLCLPKLSRIFEERDTQISNSLKAAHQAKDEAIRIKAEYEAILAQAAKVKNEMFTKAVKDLSRMIDDKMAAFDNELMVLIHNSEKEMQSFENKMETDIEKIAKEAALAILKNLGDINFNEELITESLKEIKSKGSYAI